MNAIISYVAETIRMAFNRAMEPVLNLIEGLFEEFHAPPAERPLPLDNAEPNYAITTKSGSIQLVFFEKGMECELYISMQNDQGAKRIEITIHQNRAVSSDSEIEITWKNPTTGSRSKVVITYPVDVRDIMNIFN